MLVGGHYWGYTDTRIPILLISHSKSSAFSHIDCSDHRFTHRLGITLPASVRKDQTGEWEGDTRLHALPSFMILHGFNLLIRAVLAFSPPQTASQSPSTWHYPVDGDRRRWPCSRGLSCSFFFLWISIKWRVDESVPIQPTWDTVSRIRINPS